MEEKGLFFVIEGSDGSGKSTQYKLLVERLKSEGYEVKEIKFPRYNEEASYFERKYLSGDYGSAEELGPYVPSLFYALDRFDGGKQIQQWLNEGVIVLADRYIRHQNDLVRKTKTEHMVLALQHYRNLR